MYVLLCGGNLFEFFPIIIHLNKSATIVDLKKNCNFFPVQLQQKKKAVEPQCKYHHPWLPESFMHFIGIDSVLLAFFFRVCAMCFHLVLRCLMQLTIGYKERKKKSQSSKIKSKSDKITMPYGRMSIWGKRDQQSGLKMKKRMSRL